MPSSKDITEEFTAAASALPLGELVQDDYFTLAESVGALEIMDPKMDSGLLEPGEPLEPVYDVGQDISPEQLVGVMDQLLCFEAAWHQGNPLAQTVFTCLYIDNLLWPTPVNLAETVFKVGDRGDGGNELVHLVLRAYCCALLKACDFVHARITHEQYYEDEDFSAHLYNRWLLSSVPVEEVADLLANAQVYIENAHYVPDIVKSAISERLQLRAYVLEALKVHPVKSPHLMCLSFAKSHDVLAKIKESAHLGTPIPEAFSHKVQRKLVSSTPPRPIVEISFDEAYDEFTRLCIDAQTATGILKCRTPGNAINFIIAFMSQPKQPNVFVRCLLQTLTFSDGMFLGCYVAKDFILADLAQLIVGDGIIVDPANEAAEAPQSSRFQIASNMNQFAASTAHAFTDLARCLCMNRSRARRLLSHTLNDWENLQFECEDIDVRLQEYSGEAPLIDRMSPNRDELWSYPLSSWVYAYKVRQMEWTVQFGFELNIYQRDEMAPMFWYLRYLADVRAQHMTRVTTFTRRTFGLLRKPTRAQVEKFELTLATLDVATAEARATVSFAECLGHLYKALTVLDLLPVPPRPYSNQSLRHSLRMKPFLLISLPPVPSQAELEMGIETGVKLLSTADTPADASMAKALSLLGMADESAKNARRAWDALARCDAEAAQWTGCEERWRMKTKDVLKSVIAAGIAIVAARKAVTMLKQQRQDGKADDVKRSIQVTVPERGYHEWWPVPNIKAG